MDSSSTRHLRSSQDMRFLGPYPYPSPSSPSSSSFELTEADVCFSADFSRPSRLHRTSAAVDSFDPLRHPNAGILSILPSAGSTRSKVLLALPRPAAPDRDRDREYSKSLPSGGRFPRSEPMRVPLAGSNLGRKKRSSGEEYDEDNGCGEEEEMLPPHEMTARGSRMMTSFSVLEGAGRTLKGRDLRQVRNAIWRQTGFLDSLE